MKRLMAGIGLVLLVGCQPPPAEMTEAEIAQVEAEVEAAVAGLYEAIRQLDAAEAMEFWANARGFAVAADGLLTVGYDTWAPMFRGNFEGTSEVQDIQFNNPQIVVLGPDAASLSSEFEWTMVTVEGDTISAHGSWTYVMKFLDGRWRAVQSAGTHLYE